MRPHAFASLVSIVLMASPLLFATGCDQLNKPLSTSSSSSSSSGSSKASEGDAGDDEEGGTAAPAPSFTAQPGDIQL